MNNDKTQKEIVSKIIDDLNAEKKPQIDYKDEEIVELLETIRAVRRLKRSFGSFRHLEQKKKATFPLWKKTALVASLFIFITTASLFVKKPLKLGGRPETLFKTEEIAEYGNNLEISSVHEKIKDIANSNISNIALAMTEGYEKLESYSGIIEIRSETNGKVDFLETIESVYKKPNKFKAYHEYSDTKFKKISDGDKLIIIYPDSISIDYLNPEKELWRYHIEQSIRELEEAKDLKEVGKDKVAGRDAILYEYNYGDKSLINRLWIDEVTMLPLKREMNLPDGRLTNGFVKIDINPAIEDSEFSYDLKEAASRNIKIKYLNKKVSLKEIKKVWPKFDDFDNKLVKGYNFIKAVDLQSDEGYNYMIKYQTDDKRFLDIYIGTHPQTDYYLPNAKHGKLSSGWVELEQDAINVGKIYIGKSNTAKWVALDFEVFLVSDMPIKELEETLEVLAGEKINIIGEEELQKLGPKPVITKEGH